ncbi:MAG: ABC transporter permease [Microthrixaceae bacterium]|nr:ABC transporter permease [Microthrixaceae bacterium]MCB1011607.1 ABC transporter permease [Microthrixaceae bacterium]MCO5319877.1 ABC transporter permease [Microthrixaceae bacterium]
MIDGLTSWWDFVSQRWDEVFEATLQTAQMVALAMAIGTVICIVLGVIAHRVAWLREPLLAVASVAITIPSLALFAIFIPVVGIGNTPAIIALVIYSLMPILRNTITGLDGVDPAIVEAAKGVGLSGFQRLRIVELPLAWPVILTGVRISALLNTGIAAIAVLVGGNGLGIFINDGLNRYPLPTSVERTWTGIVFTVLLALLFDLAFSGINRLTTSKGIRS